MRLPRRQRVAGRSRRRRGGGSRAPAFLNRWRVAGAALALASAAAVGFLITDDRFELDPQAIEIAPLEYTSAETVRQALDVPAGSTPNVFRLDTEAMERRLRALPAVAQADVSVALPDQLIVDVVEHEPVFALEQRDNLYLIADQGFVLDAVPAISLVDVPRVEDMRGDFAPELEVGGRLNQIDTEAILRLAAITPATVASDYQAVTISVDDANGYMLSAHPDGWRAIFGHYTQTLRPVDIIGRQIQCLRARVHAGERELAVVYLAPLGDGCGTYLPRHTPRASPSPAAAASARM